VSDTRIVVSKSRFEVDMNRPRDKAIYLKSEDAWGLNIWKKEPDIEIINQSLEYYDYFYSQAMKVLKDLEERFGKFVVFDIHSYNHRRKGPNESPASADENPEINIGTGTMNRSIWAPVVDRFLTDLKNFQFQGRYLD
ncbi:MAG: N-formylglutamate amidohydrolase, partial [Candidatus Dadabacteria bacterium]|nr:N-formylglutamate amidohydrolase [Candidatus Dadabacteria bacterium]